MVGVTRRRLIALLSATVLAAPIRRGRAEEVLPDCLESGRAGSWEWDASDLGTSLRTATRVEPAAPFALSDEEGWSAVRVEVSPPDMSLVLPRRIRAQGRTLDLQADIGALRYRIAVDGRPLQAGDIKLDGEDKQLVAALVGADAGRLLASGRLFAIDLVDGRGTGAAGGVLLQAVGKVGGYARAAVAAEASYRTLSAAEANDQCAGACFVTTACCELLGLPDDCWELRTLRRFRDNRLAHMPGGAANIALYYERAPRILRAIARRRDRRRLLAVTYWRFVLPAALLAAAGLPAAARRRYTAMMRVLGRVAETADRP